MSATVLIHIRAVAYGHGGGADEPLFLSVRHPSACDVRPAELASYAGGCTCWGHTVRHLTRALSLSDSEENCVTCEAGNKCYWYSELPPPAGRLWDAPSLIPAGNSVCSPGYKAVGACG